MRGCQLNAKANKQSHREEKRKKMLTKKSLNLILNYLMCLWFKWGNQQLTLKQ